MWEGRSVSGSAIVRYSSSDKVVFSYVRVLINWPPPWVGSGVGIMDKIKLDCQMVGVPYSLFSIRYVDEV